MAPSARGSLYPAILACVLAALAGSLFFGAARADGPRDQAGGRGLGAEILWDEFAIPHIYARNEFAAVRGLGYAEMENHAETILMSVAAARGRMAEYFGAGDGNANVENDIMVRTEGIPGRARAWLRNGGKVQEEIIRFFVDGANEYASRHGDTIDPLFRQILPLVPEDITAGIQYIVQFNFMLRQDNIPDLIAAWKAGGKAAANAFACSHTPGCPANPAAVAQSRSLGGSNGWAIAPQKSASGNAILMGNPHLPWGNNSPIPGLGIYQWMEANLVIGDPNAPSLNASGSVLMGAPFFGIGYSDALGWTHTNNTIQNTNLYELTLSSDGTYEFGGHALPLEHTADTIKIRTADGSLQSQTIDIFASVHGPVVARSANKALALRVAGLDQPALVAQYWQMIKARNLAEFKTANSALQMPFFNVVYADRDGHILYLFGGRQPVRNGGSFGDYAGVLDGSDPNLLWTSTFPWSALPQAIDPEGGFVANANDPPWTAAFPQTPSNDPSNFPAYVAPQFMDLRAQANAAFLLTAARLRPTDVINGKESTHMLLADRVLPDLLAGAAKYGDAFAKAAAAVLAGWDRTADAASKGAALFEAWWAIVMNDARLPKDNTINFYSSHPLFRIGFDPARPLSTPSGLASGQADINLMAEVDDLSLAAQLIGAASCATPPCPLDVPWGAVHDVVLVTHDATFEATIPVSNDPQSGADDPFGLPRVVDRLPSPLKSPLYHFWAYGGDGYVEVVEFTKRGAKAQALVTYGNASRPGSPHITDQLPYYDSKKLRPVYRARGEVEQHTVAREVVD